MKQYGDEAGCRTFAWNAVYTFFTSWMYLYVGWQTKVLCETYLENLELSYNIFWRYLDEYLQLDNPVTKFAKFFEDLLYNADWKPVTAEELDEFLIMLTDHVRHNCTLLEPCRMQIYYLVGITVVVQLWVIILINT